VAIQFPTTNAAGECLCQWCCDQRADETGKSIHASMIEGDYSNFRYACEVCGCKRCPHHADHRFRCTGSNEPGQVGVLL
jgi:hypothetical protein